MTLSIKRKKNGILTTHFLIPKLSKLVKDPQTESIVRIFKNKERVMNLEGLEKHAAVGPGPYQTHVHLVSEAVRGRKSKLWSLQ